jgi:uncharacterized protein YbbC (DUF1343 family)
MKLPIAILQAALFAMIASCGVAVKTNPAETAPAKVKTGVDVLLEKRIDLLTDKRVGLITNSTGVTSDLRSTIDVLHSNKKIKLVALFGPEHGVRGDVNAGETVASYTDERTGIPVYSLYGKTRKPTPEMLRGIDILVYDIQDIGLRTYTYIYTMALAMRAASENGIPFVVLDRPNPLGGLLVEGPLLDKRFKSSFGMYPIPYIYGLTVGELAKLFNEEYSINADLTIVPMEGWRRGMTFDDTGLEWVPTSPHIPHAKTAFFCAATGSIGELHTVNVGIGYTSPFELIGAVWIDARKLADELNNRKLPGTIFRPLHYRPYYTSSKNQELQGIQIHIVDEKSFLPIATQIHILTALNKLFPEQHIFKTPRINSFYKAIGTDKISKAIEAGKTAEEIISGWQPELEKFKELRKKYLIY